jgi:hypothetical protein
MNITEVVPYCDKSKLNGIGFGVAIGCDVPLKMISQQHTFRLVSILFACWRINFGVRVFGVNRSDNFL